MRIRVSELEATLERGLAPIYLLSGDEPLQMKEAADAIRRAARDGGYDEREVLEADNRFDWGRLAAEANSLSLFAQRRLIDLRIPSGKPGAEGGRALAAYAAAPPPDTLLLITLPKLERGQSNSKWFKALERAGALVQVWPIEGAQLSRWVEQRLRRAGLEPAPGVVPMLTERIEGNLLAAVQEIDKLLLLNGPGRVTPERLAGAVADSARYDVFGLVDAALQGQVARGLRMLGGLQAEGTAAPVVLWALAREIRTLTTLAGEVARGTPPARAVGARRDIWDKRRPLVTRGLQRLELPAWRGLLRLCARTDRAIKGQDPSDPWLLMQQIVARMAGAPVPMAE
ncbi:MAG TPA: DNA polymerase III subunit delta [Sedimenticola thiotaurini]|uniref:DNA polymerase III subunit delta n=1 Tax=Sedimenticola thiotaurini TaxID=1543721 RepID=A0A831RMP6_9GAMM|nr:DNA polymerase III subunit delta [Sedimenticola thiotaurini]